MDKSELARAQCEDCIFAESYNENEASFLCYRFPPVFIRLIEDDCEIIPIFEHPEVYALGKCGEFIDKWKS